MAEYYDRYNRFKINGIVNTIPGIVLPNEPTDKMVTYKLGQTRLDKLSQTYYGNPYHGWLILLANQQYGGLEFNIPDMSVIRIPYPFKSALERYINEIDKNIKLYGK